MLRIVHNVLYVQASVVLLKSLIAQTKKKQIETYFQLIEVTEQTEAVLICSNLEGEQ